MFSKKKTRDYDDEGIAQEQGVQTFYSVVTFRFLIPLLIMTGGCFDGVVADVRVGVDV